MMHDAARPPAVGPVAAVDVVCGSEAMNAFRYVDALLCELLV